MGRLFGTDGARGVAITELTCEKAMQIGRAAAAVLTKHTDHKAKILIGKDTRISSDVLESALAAGVCSMGADVEILGVVPTPAVAYLVTKYKADAGVMISASHNTVEYNGIKLFSKDGFKLPDEIENEIEELILDTPEKLELKSGIEIGRIKRSDTALRDYIDHIKSTINGDLSGLRFGVDCANGSSSETAETLFKELGAECVFINNKYDGTNINDNAGSTHIDVIGKFVKENGLDGGVAFDGDADRCLAVDENGEIIDGDKMIAILSKSLKEQGKLKKDAAVMTVMTNMGFFDFAKENGIEVVTTKVGDRYVLEEMLASGYNIGGEQSGHIIFLDYATTGDGQLSAVQMMSFYKKCGKKMSELGTLMQQYPQVLVNVKVTDEGKKVWKDNAEIKNAISDAEAKLNSSGRVLIRESGTEPLVRVMLEGKDNALITEQANLIADMIRERYGR